MGRHIERSDAEKRAAGRTDPRYSDLARRQRQLDKVIIPFPTLQKIPEPSLPLRPPGRREYDLWTRRLLNGGLLTIATVEIVERLALAKDAIQMQYDKGKSASAKYLEILRGAQQELKVLNVDQPLGPGQGKDNKFSDNGFPARLRAAGD